MLEHFLHVHSLFRVFGHHLSDQVLALLRYFVIFEAQALLQYFLLQKLELPFAERHVAGKETEEQHSQTPHIGAEVLVPLVEDYFRGEVSWSAALLVYHFSYIDET